MAAYAELRPTIIRIAAVLFLFHKRSDTKIVPAVTPALVAMSRGGEPTIDRITGFASCPPTLEARSVVWTSRTCSPANVTYSVVSIGGRVSDGLAAVTGTLGDPSPSSRGNP